MAAQNDTASMALFCDFENIALGVRDAQYEKFDIQPVLERLLAKGNIVVKKAYCDWDRYKTFKAGMHEANFELIEIPHVRQSGKNSADIRMVVDALDLCYTKAHVDTFVIISGDSDFSPLVSKLRENAKKVIGVGVKQSCSDLLVTNCDEFIYYDDLVREREAQRAAQRREREKRSPEEEQKRREKMEERKTRAVELASATLADMLADRGDNERVWASVLKEVIKRRNPGFNENYFGFRSFGNLLDEAASRGLLAVGRDEKSGTYVTRAQARSLEMLESAALETETAGEAVVTVGRDAGALEATGGAGVAREAEEKPAGRRRSRGGRKTGRATAVTESAETVQSPAAEAVTGIIAEVIAVSPAAVQAPVPAMPLPEGEVAAEPAAKPRRGGRRPRKATEQASAPVEAAAAPAVVAESPAAGESPERGKSGKGEKAKTAKAKTAKAKTAKADAAKAEGETATPAKTKRPARSRKPKAEAVEG